MVVLVVVAVLDHYQHLMLDQVPVNLPLQGHQLCLSRKANTGGGGGGGATGSNGNNNLAGGSGGSGIVVIRYQIAQLGGTAKATGGAVTFLWW